MLPLVRLVDIRATPLSVDEVFQAVQDPAAGGTALFVGTVRDVDPTIDPEATVAHILQVTLPGPMPEPEP